MASGRDASAATHKAGAAERLATSAISTKSRFAKEWGVVASGFIWAISCFTRFCVQQPRRCTGPAHQPLAVCLSSWAKRPYKIFKNDPTGSFFVAWFRLTDFPRERILPSAGQEH